MTFLAEGKCSDRNKRMTLKRGVEKGDAACYSAREVNVNVMSKNTGNFAHRANLKIDDYKEKS